MSDYFFGSEVEGGVQAVFQSFAMIIASEIGDKTFLIAAILAMRHPRMIVFSGAFGSLAIMSLLSAVMGHILPTLIPRKWTQVAAAILFLVFGAKMLMEARAMEGGNGKIQEEMKEAEEEIEEDEADRGDDEGEAGIPLEAIEEGGRQRPRANSVSKPKTTSFTEGARNFCSLVLGPVFVQAFVLTFLGEWGDRSQIATIALGAAHVSSTLVSVGSKIDTGVECLPRDSRYCGGTCVLYCAGGHWRPVCLNEDICEAWYVFLPRVPRP